jgi:hypothetical protein
MPETPHPRKPVYARGPRLLGWTLAGVGLLALAVGLSADVGFLNVVGTVLTGVGLGQVISRWMWHKAMEPAPGYEETF